MYDHIQKKIDRQLEVFDMNQNKNRFLFQLNILNNNRPPSVLPLAENITERLDFSKKNYEYLVKLSEKLDDDSIPYLTVNTGTEIFAEALGCKVFYPPNNIPCAIHFVSNVEESNKVKLKKLEDTPLMLLFDMADELYSFGGKETIYRLPDIQSPMDIVAQIWDKVDLCYAYIEEPNAIKELANNAYTLLTEFLDEWFRRYGTKFVSHYPNYYMESGLSLTVDEVGIISPELFEQFFLTEINKLSEKYGGVGIHCCAISEHQFDNFRSVENLKLLNLYRPDNIIENAFKVFEGKCVQCHGGYLDGIPRVLSTQPIDYYPPNAHIILRENIDSLDSAMKRCDELSKIFRN